MHTTCVTPAPDLGEGRDSSTYVPCFFSFGPVVDKEELLQIVSEYDQEIPHLQTADNPVAPCYKVLFQI